MTLRDIEELRVNEFEEILQGFDENAEKLNEQMGNGGQKMLEGDDAIRALLGK
ncbi:hypothetical protein [Mitsuokella sp.]|uniref:hypothetical protein n=1 Tax=Mitsuokella sp. TaxID=2049034 RepID=UPI002A802160|nr:hypothetical protein [Mitsuokella sp.]